MNSDAEPDVNAVSRPDKNAERATDEAAELERELSDDELALIAGGVSGVNETHTMVPGIAKAQKP